MSDSNQNNFDCSNNFFWIGKEKFIDIIPHLSEETKQEISNLLKTDDDCKDRLSFAMSEGSGFQDWNKVVDFIANDLGVPMLDFLMKHHNNGLSGDFLSLISSASDVKFYQDIGINFSEINMTKHAWSSSAMAKFKSYDTLSALKDAGLNFTQIDDVIHGTGLWAVDVISEAFALLQGNASNVLVTETGEIA